MFINPENLIDQVKVMRDDGAVSVNFCVQLSPWSALSRISHFYSFVTYFSVRQQQDAQMAMSAPMMNFVT
jgi:hypothetical protein